MSSHINGYHFWYNHPVKAQQPDQSASVFLSRVLILQICYFPHCPPIFFRFPIWQKPIFLMPLLLHRQILLKPKAQAKKVARFLLNSERHWGRRARRQSKHAFLLGPKQLNEHLKHIENRGTDEQINNDEDEHKAKRQKISEDETTDGSWICRQLKMYYVCHALLAVLLHFVFIGLQLCIRTYILRICQFIWFHFGKICQREIILGFYCDLICNLWSCLMSGYFIVCVESSISFKMANELLLICSN